jgi:hypothetical protein
MRQFGSISFNSPSTRKSKFFAESVIPGFFHEAFKQTNDLKLLTSALIFLTTFRTIESIWQNRAEKRLEIPIQCRKTSKAHQARDICPLTFGFQSPIHGSGLHNQDDSMMWPIAIRKDSRTKDSHFVWRPFESMPIVISRG